MLIYIIQVSIAFYNLHPAIPFHAKMGLIKDRNVHISALVLFIIVKNWI